MYSFDLSGCLQQATFKYTLENIVAATLLPCVAGNNTAYCMVPLTVYL